MGDDALTKGLVNRAGALLVRADQEGRETGLTTVDPADYEAAVRVVDAWRASHARPLQATNANLYYYVRDYPGCHPTQRTKKLATIIDKLQRHPGDLARMEDIGGCRIVLPTVAAVDDLADRLKGQDGWEIVRLRDYIRRPKDDGYRALHLVRLYRDRRIEIQVRTTLQDMWANRVEHIGRDYGQEIKFGRADGEVVEYHRLLSDLLAVEEKGGRIPQDLVQELQRAADSLPALRRRNV
ncbi:hypothetical protein AB0L40_09380 [Patulibacter sp. NPDC049589]|uniref:hypothetical protein n=1 Tax=Patulibacter sp. NPDC049589 TaxID=3154731 RepID=UPI003432F7A3